MVTLAPKLRIGPRDRKLFWHVLRYGMTRNEVVHRLFFSDAQKPEAARSTLRRLAEGGYLTYEKDPWPYYRLSASAVALLEPLLGVNAGTYRAASAPLKLAPLVERDAILSFCCLGSTSHRALLQHEFDGYFSDYARSHIRSWPYHLESHPDGYALCYIVVDSFSRVSLQVERVEKQFRKRLTIEAVRELNRRGRFRVTVLTGDAQRAAELNAAFYDAHLEAAHVEVIARLKLTALAQEPH